MEWMTVHFLLFLLSGFFWMIGINNYMNLALEKKEIDVHSFLLVLVYAAPIFDIINVLIGGMPLFTIVGSVTEKILIVLYFLVLILITIKIKKVFYERSGWFIFLELVFYPFGILTLTPEIRNHYAENKEKMDKIFSGNANDEEILNS